MMTMAVKKVKNQIPTKNHQLQAVQIILCILLHCSGNSCLLSFHQLVNIKSPSQSIVQFIFFIFKILDMFGGYLCFVISILCIGIVTAVIGDVASHFGCTLGIKDSVTAIVFVALGTSIPGNVKN
jgi:hypothetical protein